MVDVTDILVDADKCPLCAVYNLVWHDMVELARRFGVEPDRFCYHGDTQVIGGYEVASGSACWDSPYGDRCGACGESIINTETATIGPMGLCHA